MGRTNCWKLAWSCSKKTRVRAKMRKRLKRENHRQNRIIGKKLDDICVPLTGWDVY